MRYKFRIEFDFQWEKSTHSWMTVGLCENEKAFERFLEQSSKELKLPKSRWRIKKISMASEKE